MFKRKRERDTADARADALVVGLGNPGAEYERTRHNIGFAVVDVLAERASASWRTTRQRALVTEITLPGPEGTRRVALAKPQTYMNVSGESVKALVGHYGVPLAELLIVHDELDLDLAVLRMKLGGGTAGHNGLQSIVRTCSSKDFVRLRFGIGRPPGRMPGADFVLKQFAKNDLDDIEIAVRVAADMVESWVARGIEPTQNMFH